MDVIDSVIQTGPGIFCWDVNGDIYITFNRKTEYPEKSGKVEISIFLSNSRVLYAL